MAGGGTCVEEMGVNGRAAGFALGYGVTMLVAMFAVQVHRRRRERQRRDVSAAFYT